MAYEYTFVHGPLASNELVEELSALYSGQYGIWSFNAPRNPGRRVRLAPAKVREWLTADSKIALAKCNGQVIGYAIAVQVKIKDYGVISWVTQLVIHEAHRHLDVGKTLLFSIWGFSDHFAWGLVTANPYAIRALEKATRRRCSPERIARNKRKLFAIGTEQTSYVRADTPLEVTAETSRINTQFFLDHSELGAMLANATVSAPWLLGAIEEGWEWFAFTFHDQDPIGLSPAEIDKMIKASDQVTRQAYSRMQLGATHHWAQHTPAEARLVAEYCRLSSGKTVLDLGCGNGRHVLELAAMGLNVTGVDYLPGLFDGAKESAARRGLTGARFIAGDARSVDLKDTFDAVICLYDVIGSYAEDAENLLMLENCSRHLTAGGMLLMSVMNFELTEHQARHFFCLAEEPNRLADLQPSHTMETTGNVFNPEFYMIDRQTGVVYRKEQFTEGDQLPAQLVVRDRRYRRGQIEEACRNCGLEVIWSRLVQKGHVEDARDRHDSRAKEILVLCRKPGPASAAPDAGTTESPV